MEKHVGRLARREGKCHCGVNVCTGFKKLREVAKVTFATNKMQQFRMYILVFTLLFTARRFYSSLAVYLFAVDWRMDVTSMFFCHYPYITSLDMRRLACVFRVTSEENV